MKKELRSKNSKKASFLRMGVFVLADIAALSFCYFFALFLRFDFIFSKIPREYLLGWLYMLPAWILATIVVFYCFRLYHSVWTLVSLMELRNIIFSYFSLVPVYGVLSLFSKVRMPISYYVMGFVLSFLGTLAIRFGYRFFRYFFNYFDRFDPDAERVMIIGAGRAGGTIIRELQGSGNFRCKICCAIDDNPAKIGRFINGVEIVGDRYAILVSAAKFGINKIIFAIPSCPKEDRKEILNICKEAGCKIQTVPDLFRLESGGPIVNQLREIDLSDLLGRDPISIDNQKFLSSLEGKVVLVTGGGGSIGSELCRQIARSNPKRLIIFDIYENNAYEIQQELKRSYPQLNLTVLIGSVRNTNRVNFVIRTYRPNLVFHAAAHKHVPLMEESPNEAIKNNVLGTYKTALAAEKYGVEKFVLISTDKAVNPTNIMGASKRLCEMVVQMMERRENQTDFCAVRFGNVLGSNGSVVPLFKKQIAQGGPVTITDKRIIRFFMTIPEAVSLVLQAAHYATGGEIFVLDMGEPVKIDDMARNLIRLSGYRPDVDIKIVYTGLRPGEKLYEELLMDEEGLRETENHLIYIGSPIQMDDEFFLEKLKELEAACKEESDSIRQLVSELVPTYRYQK